MTRDYKKHAKANNSDANQWVWFIGGLAIGLVIALTVYVKDQSAIKSLRAQINPKPAPSLGSDAIAELGARIAADDSEMEPRFTFYEELPRFEVTVPAAARSPSPNNGDTGSGVDEAELNAAYLLQAGSFRNLGDAEQLKAELALLGMRAYIESAQTEDQQTWHRVRLGPYSGLPEVHDAEAMLIGRELDTLIMKVPQPE